MAEYNSVYTGAEVDEAVGRAAKILESVQVYAGSPANTGIPLSVIPVNPTTGDKLGVYDVIFAPTTTPIDDAAQLIYTSRIYLKNETQVARGATVFEIQVANNTLDAVNCDFNNDIALMFNVKYKTYDMLNATGTTIDWYIHEIYRLQEVQ